MFFNDHGKRDARSGVSLASTLFASDQGTFLSSYGNGNGNGNGSANAPWKWDDGDDTPAPGELATDPVHVSQWYFKNFGSFSTTYTRNTYKGI